MIDVTVMGGGVFGLSIAYVCAARGATVRLIERRAIAAGSSGGMVGAMAPHTPDEWNTKKEFQFQSMILARSFWPGVEAISGIPTGYSRAGRLQAIADNRALEFARARVATARALWHGEAVWQVVASAACGGWQPISPSGYLIHDTLSARIEPRRACESLAGAVRALGGEIVLGEGMPEGKVIWATGWQGLVELSEALGWLVGNGVKGQALALRHDARGAPQLFADGLHIIPHDDGTVAIGSTSERYFDGADETDNQLEVLHERAVVACPILHGAPVVARWAGVRPRAKSRSPVLGPWPDRPGHYIANGGFKIGFAMAPKVAEVMADLVLDGRDGIPDGFRIEDNR